MTLKEIAREANVSVSTVSRVLNSKGSLKDKESYRKIWEIVKREHYTPNKAAQALKKNASRQRETPRMISCMLARTQTASDDPFFQQMARSIDEQAYKQNYIVKHLYTERDFLTLENMKNIYDKQSSGIIIMGRCESELLKVLKKNFRYVGYTGLNYLNAKYDQTTCNGLLASETAVNYLIELGHRKIGYIGETQNEIRYEGYCHALEKNGIPLNKRLIADVTLSLDGGYRGVNQLLSNQADITAIFCANDTTALGALSALKKAKKRVPKDISVIGIDDIPLANYASPPLTTVHIPIVELGQLAFRILIDRIEGNHQLPMHIDLPFYLIERESCSPPYSL